MTTLTTSELKILRAIAAAPGEVLGWEECRKAAALTHRGGRVVMNRMVDCRLIALSEAAATYRWPALTFKGMKALEAEQVPA